MFLKLMRSTERREMRRTLHNTTNLHMHNYCAEGSVRIVGELKWSSEQINLPRRTNANRISPYRQDKSGVCGRTNTVGRDGIGGEGKKGGGFSCLSEKSAWEIGIRIFREIEQRAAMSGGACHERFGVSHGDMRSRFAEGPTAASAVTYSFALGTSARTDSDAVLEHLSQSEPKQSQASCGRHHTHPPPLVLPFHPTSI